MHTLIVFSFIILTGSFQNRQEFYTPTMEQVLLETKDVRFTDSSAHATFDTVEIRRDSLSVKDSVWSPLERQPEVIRGPQPPSGNGPFETVRVKMLLTKEGKVRRAVIHSSENPARNRLALTFAMMYTFTPAIQKGEPVQVWVSIPIRFQK
jgi:TonB family protein